jgi:hypothetical protein
MQLMGDAEVVLPLGLIALALSAILPAAGQRLPAASVEAIRD